MRNSGESLIFQTSVEIAVAYRFRCKNATKINIDQKRCKIAKTLKFAANCQKSLQIVKNRCNSLQPIYPEYWTQKPLLQ